MDGIPEFEALVEQLKAGQAVDGVLFSEETLAGLHLAEAQLLGTKFNACDLSNIDLSDAQLPDILFNKCVLDGANFSGADLSGAVAVNAIAPHVKFKRAILTGMMAFSDTVPVKDSSQVMVSFEHLKLPGFAMDQLKDLGILGFKEGVSNFSHADFSGAFGERCEFEKTDLKQAVFVETNLDNSLFSHCDLSATDFSRARLNQTIFDHSNLSDTGFTTSHMTDSQIIACELGGCDFGSSNFQGWSFRIRICDRLNSFLPICSDASSSSAI